MATSSQPSLLSYHFCCCSNSNTTNSTSATRFPSSISLSTLHGSRRRTQLSTNHSLSLTRTHAKFEKFEGSEDSPVQLQQEDEQVFPQVKEEDDE